MLNHSETALLADGRSQSGLRQGVTLAVFGESSMGPLSDQMKRDMTARQGDIKFDITWTTLGEYLDHLVDHGVATNVASFVSASTVRANEIGYDNRPPTPDQLDRMRAHVRRAMSEGAMGLTTALIYTPAVFAKTDELVELAKVASEAGGMYISHMRSEGNKLLEAIDETITIAKQAKIRAEIYHLKEGGQSNWNKLGDAIAKIEAAQKDGVQITADMGRSSSVSRTKHSGSTPARRSRRSPRSVTRRCRTRRWISSPRTAAACRSCTSSCRRTT
jgi:N-acyl-D-amino-acid deacylase